MAAAYPWSRPAGGKAAAIRRSRRSSWRSMTAQSVSGPSNSGALATSSVMTRARAPLADSLPAIRVQKSMTGFSDSSVRKGTPPISSASAVCRSVTPVRPVTRRSDVAMGSILPPEEPAGGAGVCMPVIWDVAHVTVQPVFAELALCHVLQMLEHMGEMLGGRVHPVLPPHDHRRLANLTLGDPADVVLVEPRRDPLGAAQHAVGGHAPRAQYLLAIGSSSAGNRGMIWAPPGVTITSSSIRAAEVPSVAGQYVSTANIIPACSSIGSSNELSRLMIGRSCRPRPMPWQKLRPKAAISLSKPMSCALGNARAILSVVTPGLMRAIASSIHSRAFL